MPRPPRRRFQQSRAPWPRRPPRATRRPSISRRWRCAPLSSGRAISRPSSARAGAVHAGRRATASAAGYSSVRVEVDQAAVQPVADGPPQVLLDQPAGRCRRAARPRRSSRGRLGDAGHDQRRQRRRTRRRWSGRRRSAPRPCRTRGAGAPTTRPACTRRSSACGRGSRRSRRRRAQRAEGVGHAAARERAREDLACGRECRPRVAAVEVRRVGGDGQQHRQHGPQAVAHRDGAVGAAHADVDVQREGVVAPGDVLQPSSTRR